MHLPQFKYLNPSNTDELVDFLADHKAKARILAGGTDIILNMLERLITTEYLIDVGGIKSLKSITYTKGKELRIGAGATMQEIAGSPIVKERFHALYQAAQEVGSPQIRAMATIGGNACNASPAADTPPALVALCASVVLVSKQGKREMPLEDFIQGNRKTDLKPDEFLECFVLPDIAQNSASRFGLISPRAAVEIDTANLALSLTIDPKSKKVKDVRIAMGSVAPVPLRATNAEKLLDGQKLGDDIIDKAAKACSADSKPISDIRASDAYRRHVIAVLASQLIKETQKAIVMSSGEDSE